MLDKEDEAFFCLKALQRLSNDAFPPAQFIRRYALGVSLFRSLLPQLFAHLQGLFVDTSRWLQSWLQSSMRSQMGLGRMLRWVRPRSGSLPAAASRAEALDGRRLEENREECHGTLLVPST